MILNASGRCDVLAYYSKWLINRIKAGYVDVRNPFYPTQVSRIKITPETIDLIVFCSKNPIPILDYLEELKDYRLLFQVTITPYQKDLEPNVPDKQKIIECVKTLSQKYGNKAVLVRYDPILLNKKYTLEYHKMMFERLCVQLEGFVSKIIISFIDMKKNTLMNAKENDLQQMKETQMIEVAEHLSMIAKKYQIQLQTCAEIINLNQFNISQEGCLSASSIFEITHSLKKHKKNGNRAGCHCIVSVDIGSYNACSHFCKYCYANFDEKNVRKNMISHDPNSSLILGHLNEDDQVKIRN